MTRKVLIGIAIYYLIGFLTLAIPLKYMLPDTSLLGMLFLATIWPAWFGQAVFGYSIPDQLPAWFIQLLFNG
jgi:hypothetical protein